MKDWAIFKQVSPEQFEHWPIQGSRSRFVRIERGEGGRWRWSLYSRGKGSPVFLASGNPYGHDAASKALAEAKDALSPRRSLWSRLFA